MTFAMLVDNWIVWVIVGLGLFIYQLSIYHIVILKTDRSNESLGHWLETLSILVSALPLLGLLGTISGLLGTFFAMSTGQDLDQSDLLTSGIADALITTQCGLVMTIPAWLLLAWMRQLTRRVNEQNQLLGSESNAS